MPQSSRIALCLGLVTTLVTRATATTIVQSFAAANCNPGTASFVYYSQQAAVEDTECKTPPPGTLAIWVDHIAADSGCSIRTFASDGCTDVLGQSISPGICYIHTPLTPILSWRIVCEGQTPGDPAPAQLAPGNEAEIGCGGELTPTGDSYSNPFSTTLLRTTTTVNFNASSRESFAIATGSPSRNPTEAATWSNTLTPTTNRVIPDATPSTAVSPSSMGGQVSGSSSNRRRSQPNSAMLLIGSLLGLGWGVLW